MKEPVKHAMKPLPLLYLLSLLPPLLLGAWLWLTLADTREIKGGMA